MLQPKYFNESAHPHANSLLILGLTEKHTDITPESPAPTSFRIICIQLKSAQLIFHPALLSTLIPNGLH